MTYFISGGAKCGTSSPARNLTVSLGTGVIAVILGHLFPEENKTRCDRQPKNGCGYMIKAHEYRCIP